MSGNTWTWRALRWVSCGLLIACASPQGARPSFAARVPYDAAATLIIFGGYGHLDGRAQPLFQQLLQGDSEPVQKLYRDLNIAMNEALADLPMAGPAKRRLSAYPIAVTNQDVKDALRRRLDRPATDLDVDNLSKHFEHVLVLALTSSLEMDTPLAYKTSVGTKYQHAQILGVTALLVSAARGDIVLTVPLISEERDELPSPRVRTLEKTVKHYERAGRAVLTLLVKRLRPAVLSDSWDAYMVADYLLHDSLQTHFADQALEEGRCQADDNSCQALAALLEHGMSESIANAGYLVLPPLRASEWGRSAEFRIGFTLRANQAVLGTDKLSLRVPASTATHRVTARLDGIASFNRGTKSKAVIKQYFVAGVSAEVVDLGGQRRSLVKSVRNSDSLVEAAWVAERFKPDKATQRAFYQMAILNALKEAEHAMAID
jgi:hypothetical protein